MIYRPKDEDPRIRAGKSMEKLPWVLFSLGALIMVISIPFVIIRQEWECLPLLIGSAALMYVFISIARFK